MPRMLKWNGEEMGFWAEISLRACRFMFRCGCWPRNPAKFVLIRAFYVSVRNLLRDNPYQRNPFKVTHADILCLLCASQPYYFLHVFIYAVSGLCVATFWSRMSAAHGPNMPCWRESSQLGYPRNQHWRAGWSVCQWLRMHGVFFVPMVEVIAIFRTWVSGRRSGSSFWWLPRFSARLQPKALCTGLISTTTTTEVCVYIYIYDIT